MNTQKKIIILLPAYNEENKIGKSVKKIKKYVPYDLINKILVINDGSTDRTEAEATDAGGDVLSLKKNKGVGNALREGIFYAIKNKYDIVVVMAGDNQDDPKEIINILEPLISDKADFVQGSRRLYGKRTINMNIFRRITTKIYSIIISILCGKKITDGTNGFRGFKIEIVKDPNINLNQEWLNRYELEPYLLFKAITLGYRVIEVPVTKVYHKSVIGYSKMVPFKDWWSILRPLIFLKLRIKK